MNYEKIQFEREIIDVVHYGINLKEVIDIFIWTIELCHI
jgi:hypothetical protein